MTRRLFMVRLMGKGGLLFGTWIGLKGRTGSRTVIKASGIRVYPGKLKVCPGVLVRGKWVG